MAETPLGKLVVELGMNTAKFDEGITKTQKQLGTLNKAIKSANEEVKLYGKGSEAVTNQLNLMNRAYVGNKQLLDDYRNQLSRQKQNLTEVKTSLESYKKALTSNETALESLKQKQTLLKDSVKQASEAMKQDKKATDEQKESLKRLKQELAENEKLLKERKSFVAELKNTVGDLAAKEQKYGKDISITESHMVRIRGTMAKLKSEYRDLAKAQAEANNRWVQTGSRWEEAGKRATESGNKILNVSRAFAPLTAAIGAVAGAGFGLATKAASDYETAVTNVRKTTDPTAEQLKEFEKGFRELAKTIPVSASELANLGGVAGQLGIKNENLLGFVETMAKLQTATNIVGEEGAADLAKFMNIMGTSQDNVSRLGSTLVELGNNFATTERDILNLGMNLAGAGKQIGLSEGDVFGIATALSSVGIEAEKGGSAFSKVMINMAAAVSDMDTRAGSKLREFAGVSGMTAEEFANLFNSNPGEAIAAFVEGLGTANERGYTTLDILKEMKIKEVRLRDTLLRSGGAHKLFNDAMKTGNKAFKENTALQREFHTFSETTASKWAIFKNKLTDVAIELGNKLLPSIKDLLDNSGPFIDGLKGMIDGFINLPDPIKKVAGGLVLFSAAFSPVLGMIGHLKLFKGLFGEAIGGFLKTQGMAQVAKQSFDIVGNSVTGVASAAASASGAVGGIGTAASSSTGLLSGLISLPVLGWAVGITAALGLGYAAWKAWGEEAWNASQETKRHEETVKQWGVDVGKEIDGTLEKMQNYASDSKRYLTAGLVVDDSIKNEATTATKNTFDAMRQAADEKMEELRKVYEKLPSAVRESATKEMNARSSAIDHAKAVMEQGEKRINEIYDSASKERRAITKEETVEINRIQSEAQAELAKILGGSNADRLFNNMKEELTKFNDQQLNLRIQALTKNRDAENDSYKESKKNLENALAEQLISHSDYLKGVKQLEETHNSKMQTLALGHYQTLKEQQKRLRDSGQAEQAEYMNEAIRRVLETYGTTIDEMERLSQKQEENTKRRAQFVKDTVEGLTGTLKENAIKGNNAWESLITDETTGEIVSNIDEVIKKATESEEGWNNLKFIIQNATLTTNAQETIKETLMANGKWDELTFEEKIALVKGDGINGTIQALISAKDLWNNTEFVEKLAKIDTTAPEASEQVRKLLEEYGVAEQTFANPLNLPTMTDAEGTTVKIKTMEEATRIAQDLMSKGSHLETSTNASTTQGTVEQFTRTINDVPTSHSTTFEADTSRAENAIGWLQQRFRDLGNWWNSLWGRTPGRAVGDNYFQGGMVFLGDGKRREPFLTPQGHFGVSPATDTLYALPRGTKIWPSVGHFRNDAANDSRLLPYLPYIPKYATGTPLSFLDSRVPNVFRPNQTATNSQTSYNDNSTYSPVLKIENFHANSELDVETLFKKFAWLTKREEDRAW